MFIDEARQPGEKKILNETQQVRMFSRPCCFLKSKGGFIRNGPARLNNGAAP